MAVALISGITGQDGSFLAQQLLEQGWTVVGLVRRSATTNWWRIAHLVDQLILEEADLLDMASLTQVMRTHQPSHIYNLAAMSNVSTSWKMPILTAEVNALGVAKMLEAMRIACPEARFYQASSSEMFGLAQHSPQDERTPFYPRSPYGIAKVYAHQLTVNYRESHGLFAVSGILFNHESERRSDEFVTRKITKSVARISRGSQEKLKLGALRVRRDWGFAGDYTWAMRLMLSQEKARDYVIGTGVSWSVIDFLQRAFGLVGLNWEDHVVHDPSLLRPAEIPVLCGNAARARRELGWAPSIDFEQLVERMVRADIDRLGE